MPFHDLSSACLGSALKSDTIASCHNADVCSVTTTHMLLCVALAHGIPNPYFWWSMDNFRGRILKFSHPSALLQPLLAHTMRWQLQVPVGFMFMLPLLITVPVLLYSLLQTCLCERGLYAGRGALDRQLFPAEPSLQPFRYIHEHIKHIHNCLTIFMYLLVMFVVSGPSSELIIIRSHMILLL